MTSLVQGGGNLNGLPLSLQTFIELRAQTALQQALNGTTNEGGVNVNQLRADAAFEVGASASSVVTE